MQTQNTCKLVLNRQNLWKPVLQEIILTLSSYPSLLVEVFTRKQFGERYFSLSSAFTAVAFVMIFFVLLPGWQVPLLNGLGFDIRYSDVRGWSVDKVVTLMFIAAMLIISFYHKRDIKQHGQTLNSERYSKSSGIAFNYWYDFHGYFPRWITDRIPMDEMSLARFYQPVTAMVIGLPLVILPFTRSVGFILMASGAFYYWRSSIAYALGRDWILDKIDDKILAEHLQGTFVEDDPIQEHLGTFVMAPKPNDPNIRESVYRAMMRDMDIDPDPDPDPSFSAGHQLA